MRINSLIMFLAHDELSPCETLKDNCMRMPGHIYCKYMAFHLYEPFCGCVMCMLFGSFYYSLSTQTVAHPYAPSYASSLHG